MLIPAIRFGQMGWLSGEGAWQWDRQVVAIRAGLAGSPALREQVENVLRERGHLVVAALTLDDPSSVLRAVLGAEARANVLGLCLHEESREHELRVVEPICQQAQLPVVVFAKAPSPHLFANCLQAGAFGCLEVPSHHSELLAILGIAAARFEYFHGLHRRLADIEWSLRNPQALEEASEVLAERLGVSTDRAKQKLCLQAESRGIELRQLAQSILEGDTSLVGASASQATPTAAQRGKASQA